MKSPLLIGADLRSLSPDSLAVLKAKARWAGWRLWLGGLLLALAGWWCRLACSAVLPELVPPPSQPPLLPACPPSRR